MFAPLALIECQQPTALKPNWRMPRFEQTMHSNASAGSEVVALLEVEGSSFVPTLAGTGLSPADYCQDDTDLASMLPPIPSARRIVKPTLVVRSMPVYVVSPDELEYIEATL